MKAQGDISLIMENQMEKNMEHEMNTGIVWGLLGSTGFRLQGRGS